MVGIIQSNVFIEKKKTIPLDKLFLNCFSKWNIVISNFGNLYNIHIYKINISTNFPISKTGKNILTYTNYK